MSIPILDAKILLEKRLRTAFPSTAIAVENVSFVPPENTLYLHCQLRIDEPSDPVFGAKYRRENLSFQVFVVGPYNKGSVESLTIAHQIRDLYQRGTSITFDNLIIQMFESPQISGSTIVNNRVVIPVLIPVTVEVYN